MFDLIINFATRDERVRAAIMNGSRANPQAPRDIFQDYDILLLVTAVEDFVRDRSWIKTFGDLIIMQTPDEMGERGSERERDHDGTTTDPSFHFLMLFDDGNRIDLTFYPASRRHDLQPDSLSQLLLDKDGIMGQLPPPSNADYLTKPPSDKEYADCCNEFWWVSTYIAKGLRREELPYARYIFEHPVRDMLNRMVAWYIGVQTDFRGDSGKYGKYFEKHLPPQLWRAYVQTLADGDYENMWRSLFTMCDLFRDMATAVAQQFGYSYLAGDDERVTQYLRRVRNLPKDADEVF